MPAVMEAVLETRFSGQICINRWNYVADGVPASVNYSFALVSAMGAVHDPLNLGNGYPADGLMNTIANCMSNLVEFRFLTVRDVYSDTDFYELPFVQPLVGARGGTEAVSPVLALGYTTNRVRADIRRATKRFVGLTEGDLDAAGFLAGAFVAGQVTPLADKMSEVLTYDDEGNTLSFQPAVCKKFKYDVPDSGEPPRQAYKYFPDAVQQLANTATGVTWAAYTTARSQTSRQYGRGR